jgi:hypothetical protein
MSIAASIDLEGFKVHAGHMGVLNYRIIIIDSVSMIDEAD